MLFMDDVTTATTEKKYILTVTNANGPPALVYRAKRKREKRLKMHPQESGLIMP